MTSVLKYSKSSNSEELISQFEELLCNKWNEAMGRGLFRYSVDNIDTKQLDGEYSFLVSMNTGRLNNRRPPQKFTSVCQLPSPGDFNFTKVKPDEILFDVVNLDNDDIKGSVLINVSPFLQYNSLIIPNVKAVLAQMVTYNGLLFAIEFLMLNSKLKIFFNSMWAMLP